MDPVIWGPPQYCEIYLLKLGPDSHNKYGRKIVSCFREREGKRTQERPRTFYSSKTACPQQKLVNQEPELAGNYQSPTDLGKGNTQLKPALMNLLHLRGEKTEKHL